MHRFLALLPLLILLPQSPTGAQTATYPLRQYLNIRSAISPTLSPDGTQVAFQARITGTSQLWRVPAGSGWPEQLTFLSGNIGSAVWSPDGRWILVTADRDGDEQYQFYLVKPDGTQTVPLTSNPKVRHQFGGWSQDGKKIYYASNARNPQFFDCYVMDVDTHQEQRVYQKDAPMSAAALSNDGRTMAVTENISNFDSRLYLVDVASGQARFVTPHKGDARYNPIGFSEDDKTLYLTTDQDREFVNLAALDVAAGSLKYLQDEKSDVESVTLSPNARTLAYASNRDGYLQVSLWDMRTRRALPAPKLPQGVHTLGNFSRDNRRLALGVNMPTRNGDISVLDISSGKLTQSTFSSLAGIDSSTFVEPTLIRYKSSADGRMIPAFLYLPRNAPKDHSLPVIMSVHGGPESQERPTFNPLYQYYVSRGYAVFAPNIRGSAGYGKAYLALDNGDKRWDALKDLNAALDWIGTHPSLNGKKVAITGGSYGGFAVLAMLAHYPDRFAAGVDMFGVTDFKTFLKNTSSYRRANRAAEYGDPEKDSAYMDAVSPALHADKIAAPLLVIQGSNDPRVPESESAQIVEKVKAKNGVVDYILFPDEGHGIAKMPNRIRAYEAVVAFLDKYMK